MSDRIENTAAKTGCDTSFADRVMHDIKDFFQPNQTADLKSQGGKSDDTAGGILHHIELFDSGAGCQNGSAARSSDSASVMDASTPAPAQDSRTSGQYADLPPVMPGYEHNQSMVESGPAYPNLSDMTVQARADDLANAKHDFVRNEKAY